MNIEWKDAPDWAIGHALHVTVGGELKEVWVGEGKYQRLDQCKSFPYGGGEGDSRHNPRRYQFKYETLRPEPWNGEGLPPVGTVCELQLSGHVDWRQGEVLFVSEWFCIFKLDKGEICNITDNCYFRSIRTPEQIAQQARDEEIRAMLDVIEADHDADVSPWWKRLESLYDAGYRKKSD